MKLKTQPVRVGERACARTDGVHKAFKFTARDGVPCTVYGGQCLTADPGMFDVFVALDYGFSAPAHTWPWSADPNRDVFLFEIDDMGAPSNLRDFRALVAYLDEQVRQGRSVFVGCIGGHGRTGTVLAALYARMTGRADGIAAVRSGYCTRAVESAAQVDYLARHFKCTPVVGSKAPLVRPAPRRGGGSGRDYGRRDLFGPTEDGGPWATLGRGPDGRPYRLPEPVPRALGPRDPLPAASVDPDDLFDDDGVDWFDDDEDDDEPRVPVPA